MNERFKILAELWAFMRERKKWWLGPIIAILLLMAVLVILSANPAVAPFIYTVF